MEGTRRVASAVPENGFSSYPYTWGWLQSYPQTQATSVFKSSSDYCQIIIEADPISQRAWEGSQEGIPMYIVKEKLKKTMVALLLWNIPEFPFYSPSTLPSALKNSPANSNGVLSIPLLFLKRPFTPPSPEKHIRSLLVKRYGPTRNNNRRISDYDGIKSLTFAKANPEQDPNFAEDEKIDMERDADRR
ncbi:CDPK-related kinase [Striga asiatica]|uniref:CDPK-related kinase n=1 Tax=Striga asiatica TaxID=4170 RepID=A0A5A7PKV2_STRAF|nr:CDPK-related kinase [Striga asiatica]